MISFKEFILDTPILEGKMFNIALNIFESIITEDEEEDLEKEIASDKIKPNEISKDRENDIDDSEIEDDYNIETNKLSSNEAQKADEWFQGLQDKIYSNRKSKAKGNYYNYKTAGAIILGRLYAFRYDPITKENLHFFDETPLVIPFEFKESKSGGGFVGVNLHYIPRSDRKKVIAYMVSNNPEQVRDIGTMDVDYLDDIKNNNQFRSIYYAVRYYLLDRMVGATYVVPQDDYLNVIDLYSGKYIGMSESQLMSTLRAQQNKMKKPKIVKSKSDGIDPVKKTLKRIDKSKNINSIDGGTKRTPPKRVISGNIK